MRFRLSGRSAKRRPAVRRSLPVAAAERMLERHRDALPPRLYVG